MMDISSISLKGSTIVIKGKMIKSMATTLHVEPNGVLGSFDSSPSSCLSGCQCCY